MKNIIKIIVGVLFIAFSCTKPNKPDCVGENCPLSNGSYCSGNLINENNNCVCPENSIQLNDSLCWELDLISPTNSVFYSDFNCECFEGYLILQFLDINNQNFSGGYTINTIHSSNSISNNLTINGTSSDFNASLYPFTCNNQILYMHGSIQNDSLTYYLYYTGAADTCQSTTVSALQ